MPAYLSEGLEYYNQMRRVRPRAAVAATEELKLDYYQDSPSSARMSSSTSASSATSFAARTAETSAAPEAVWHKKRGPSTSSPSSSFYSSTLERFLALRNCDAHNKQAAGGARNTDRADSPTPSSKSTIAESSYREYFAAQQQLLRDVGRPSLSLARLEASPAGRLSSVRQRSNKNKPLGLGEEAPVSRRPTLVSRVSNNAASGGGGGPTQVRTHFAPAKHVNMARMKRRNRRMFVFNTQHADGHNAGHVNDSGGTQVPTADGYPHIDPYALSELFSQSEIPGFREIFASDSYLRKFCWIVAFLIMTVLTLNDIIELITEYYNHPITVDVRHRDSARLPFPAVTVCNLNVVRSSALCKSQSNSRFDLSNQIPSELRDKLCGIQVQNDKTNNSSDLSDINNIGIATSTTTTTSATSVATPATNSSDLAFATTATPSLTATTINTLLTTRPHANATSPQAPTSAATTLATSVSTTTQPTTTQRRKNVAPPADGGLDLSDSPPDSTAMRWHWRSRNKNIIHVQTSGARAFASGAMRLPQRLAVSRPKASAAAVSAQSVKPQQQQQQQQTAMHKPQGPLGSPAAPAPWSPVLPPFLSPQPPYLSPTQTPPAHTAGVPASSQAPPVYEEMPELTERQERELQENLTNWLAVMYNRDPKLTTSLGHQFDDMILRCTMKSINCTHQRAFESSFTPTEGNCFTYKSRVKRRASSPVPSGGGGGAIVYEDANLAGTTQGLELVLNLEKAEYISGSSQVGALVMIHHPSDLGYAASEATFVAPEFTTYIGLKMVNITRLPPPFPERCVHSWPDKFADTLTRNSTYSQQACLRICLQKTIQAHCACQSAFLPIVDMPLQPASASTTTTTLSPLPVANVSLPVAQLRSEASDEKEKEKEQQQQPQQPRIIICDTRHSVTRQCVRDVMFRAADRVHNCECPQKCQVVRYDKTISMASWPTREDKVTFDRGKLDVNFKNLAKIIVYFQTMTCEEVSQQAVYTPANLFSSLGGIMGMYVGFSFLSIFEIFEVMSRKTWHHFKRKLAAPAARAPSRMPAARTSLS